MKPLAKAFLLCALIGAMPAWAAKDFKELISHKDWFLYMNSLSYYHKFKPGVFIPPELIRFDRLPLEDLQSMSQKHALEWRRIFQNDKIEQRQALQMKVSNKANLELDVLVKRYLKIAAIHGSHVNILKTISEDQRVALTPLDASFMISDLGKKLWGQANMKTGVNWDSFSIDPSKRLLKLEDSTSAQSFVVGPKPTAGNDLTLRSIFVPDRYPATTDMSFSNRYLSGTLYGSPTSSPFPFGKFIGKEDVFVDESGQQHFSGDGHNHSHHGHKH